MSMPLPIHVALVGPTVASVVAAKRLFRLTTPGVGPAYYAALDAPFTIRRAPFPQKRPLTIWRPSRLPVRFIDLWIALDDECLTVAKRLHARDRRWGGFSRGFYEELFPEACVLALEGASEPTLKKALRKWDERISTAWFSSS